MRFKRIILIAVLLSLVLLTNGTAFSRDLAEIKQSGVLRHLGIPYANFVTGAGDGLDVELMQGFADHLGVKYQFVSTDWQSVFGDLTGRNAKRGQDGHAQLLDEVAIKGDVASNGITILPWREEIVAFGQPSFPSGVWLIARADSLLMPINPADSMQGDILQVKGLLKDRKILALKNTCLDPGLYNLAATGANIHLMEKGRKLNEMAPAIIQGKAETTLLDVPDALVALEKWPGEIKVIGPISDHQEMAPAFRRDAPQLRLAFNQYLQKIFQNGSYIDLVGKYYPAVFLHFPDFFNR